MVQEADRHQEDQAGLEDQKGRGVQTDQTGHQGRAAPAALHAPELRDDLLQVLPVQT